MPMAGAGGDLTATGATAHTGTSPVIAICVIIITTAATTTINDDNGERSIRPRSPLTDKRSQADIVRHLRFTPESGHLQCTNRCQLWGEGECSRQHVTHGQRSERVSTARR